VGGRRVSSTRHGGTVRNCRAEVDEPETRKGTLFDTRPLGFSTLISPVPGLTRSLAGICAVSVVALSKLVLRNNPFHCAMAPTKPDPVIVTNTDALPLVAEDGLTDVIAGAPAAAAVIVKLNAAEARPPGLVTVTLALPWEAIRLAGMVALSWLALT